MTFNELNDRAFNLHRQGIKSKYYEMILYYGLEDLEQEYMDQLTDGIIKILLSLVENYLDDCYQVSPYEVVDSVVICINEMGLIGFLDSDMEQELINELCSH